MREIIFEDGKREYINDDPKVSIYSGDESNTFFYTPGKLIKLCNIEDEYHLSTSQVNILKKLQSLKSPNIYKIYDFFKADYNGKLMYNGYIMKKYKHFHNDISPLGSPCFNICTIPIEQAINYYVGLYELIRKLTENHIFIDDLHRKNIIKTKSKLILIDADLYSNYSRGYAYDNNYSQMRMCFADLITYSLYLTFNVGSLKDEHLNNFSELYQKYVLSLIDYKNYSNSNMFDVVEKIKDYDTLEDFFKDNYKLTKREK